VTGRPNSNSSKATTLPAGRAALASRVAKENLTTTSPSGTTASGTLQSTVPHGDAAIGSRVVVLTTSPSTSTSTRGVKASASVKLWRLVSR
jgi:hypothetical protein